MVYADAQRDEGPHLSPVPGLSLTGPLKSKVMFILTLTWSTPCCGDDDGARREENCVQTAHGPPISTACASHSADIIASQPLGGDGLRQSGELAVTHVEKAALSFQYWFDCSFELAFLKKPFV